MSHAEYASKPLPVLTRLAVLLRHIPAVQFVLAKFGRLLRSHDASIEPVIADKLLPPSVSDDTSDAVAIDDVEIDDDVTPVTAPPVQTEREEPAYRHTLDASPEPLVEDTLPIPAPSLASDIAAIDDIATPVATPPGDSGSEVLVLRRSLDASPEPLVEDRLAAPGTTNDPVEIDAAVIAVAKPPEQSEREQLVRRRWSETGIRMWNPDVHGVGHAALNIQGSVELLPPKPGETMPRYDTLEFKLVGGRIVCEGFVVDPPERPVNRRFVGAASRP